MKTKAILKERDYRLDIIRIFALFCVISVHFFLNSGFYEQIMLGKRMYIMYILRTACMICVPLFIILTGYLMNKKTLSKNYYKGIIKTIGIYFLASLACLIYKIFFLNISFSFLELIKQLLGFSLSNYAWYIEMYIGLFLLIPFLNLIYNNLKSKKEKQILLITLFILTSIPMALNSFNLNPELNSKMFFNNTGIYTKIFPYWWISIYPITYYFTGAYLNEYKLNISKIKNILLILITAFIFGTYNFLCYKNSLFIWSPNQEYGSLQNTLLSILTFNLLLNINFNKMPKSIKFIVKHLSTYSLGAYLVSYIFDSIFYKILIENIPETIDRLLFYPIIVPIIFICSLALSCILNQIYNLIEKLLKHKKEKAI